MWEHFFFVVDVEKFGKLRILFLLLRVTENNERKFERNINYTLMINRKGRTEKGFDFSLKAFSIAAATTTTTTKKRLKRGSSDN